MNQKAANTSITPIRKRRYSDSEIEYGSSKVVAVDTSKRAISIVEQTGDISKLDTDCFEEAFDYLPAKDLVSVGKTCKRLQQVAGYCFQENYSGSVACDSKGIRCNGTNVKHFVPFIRSIWTDVDGLWYVLDVRSRLRRLKQIRVDELKSVHVNRLKDIPMSKLEILYVRECDLGNHFHEIIDHCPKLKRLKISFCKGDFNWFNRKYPTLKYLKFDQDDDDSEDTLQPIEGIAMFSEHNPNIRKFATNDVGFWENEEKLMSANIKLDDFAIHYGYIHDDEFEYFIDWLNKLHERGFYKNLQFYSLGIYGQEVINKLSAVNGLVKLYVGQDSKGYPFTFSSLKDLQELYLCNSEWTDLKTVANDLINLKRICLNPANIDNIMLFISRSVEMERIKVGFLRSGAHFDEDTGIINLLALNRAREQLPDAQKITLYVGESIYLATKWAMKGNDFGLIRLKRIGSFDWDHDYEY